MTTKIKAAMADVDMATQAELDSAISTEATTRGNADTALSNRVSTLETQRLTTMADVNATGTAVNITGIPAWAKRVTVAFSGLSLDAAAIPLLQIGDGTVVTTGYASAAGDYVPTANHAGSTAGYIMAGANGFASSGATVMHGLAILTKLTGNTWVCNTLLANSTTANTATGAGTKTLTGALDRIRLTTTAGTAAYDAGVVSVSYEA